jgi:hypothetical protein
MKSAEFESGAIFFERLVILLANEKWADKDIAGFKENALTFNWACVKDANPELAIRALQFIKKQKNSGVLGTSTGQVYLVWQIAQMEIKMRRLDFDNSQIVRTSINAIRIFFDENKNGMSGLEKNTVQLNNNLSLSFRKSLGEVENSYMQRRFRKGGQSNIQNTGSGSGTGPGAGSETAGRHKYGKGAKN